MKQVFSTDSVPPQRRLACFRVLANAAFAPIEVACDRIPAHRFSATFGRTQAGPVDAYCIEASAHSVRRPGQSRQQSRLLISLQVRGQARISRPDGEELLKPGDFAIFDAAQPYRQHFDDPMKQLVLDVRLADAPAPVEHPMHMAGRRIDGAQGIGRVASDLLRAFVEERDKMNAAQATSLFRSLAEVLNQVVRSAGDKAVAPSRRHHDFHLHRIRRFIDDNLRDPNLTPTKIALAHGISRRYLSKLFEHERDSVARYIWDQRLARCRLELEDQRLADRSVTEIAFSWGYSSASHFSRAFKQRFGMTAKQARDAGLVQRVSG